MKDTPKRIAEAQKDLHTADMKQLRAEEKAALAAIQVEQTLLTYGVLA